MTYGPNGVNNAAVLLNGRTNGNGAFVAVGLCGFSLVDIRDDDLNKISDRAKFSAGYLLCSGISPFAG
jgi:hypothetical protein